MRRIEFVQDLRGLAALMVVLYHLRGLLNYSPYFPKIGDTLFQGGPFGVDLFFIISGFIIAYSTQRNEHAKPASFLIRRFFRIYPAFFICLLVVALTYDYTKPLTDILKSALFIHQDYNQHAPTFGYNLIYPAWTITYELFFYGVFCAALAVSHKHRVWLTSAALITMMVGLQLLFNGTVGIDGLDTAHIFATNSSYGIIKIAASPMFLEFVVGMLLYELFVRVDPKYWPPAKPVLWACLSLFVAFYFARYHRGHGLAKFGVWSLLLFVPFMVAEKTHVLKRLTIFAFLGDISYSLYISHTVIFNLMEDHRGDIPVLASHPHGLPTMIIVVTVCILASWILHVMVERPFIRIGKAICDRATGRRSQAVLDSSKVSAELG